MPLAYFKCSFAFFFLLSQMRKYFKWICLQYFTILRSKDQLCLRKGKAKKRMYSGAILNASDYHVCFHNITSN